MNYLNIGYKDYNRYFIASTRIVHVHSNPPMEWGFRFPVPIHPTTQVRVDDRLRQLAIAGALIAAELDRLLRAADPQRKEEDRS